MGKRHGFLVGEPQHLPPTSSARTPLSYSGRIVLHKQPQGLRGCKTSHHDIAYLLVQIENTMRDRHYGISIVWVNPNQVRATSMEDAVKKLAACSSSGTNWPYTLAWLYHGTSHLPLPKDWHLGILPQRGAEKTPCGWISQLKVCQLLAAGPQDIYPIGLNGQDEPLITSLPEPLASSVSLTASEYIYLGRSPPSW